MGNGIKRAKYRLGRLLDDGEMVIRIKSHHDTCGQVIGKQGTNIRQIKKICGITQSLSIRWDEKSKELVLTLPFLLQDSVKTKLQTLIGDVLDCRTLTNFGVDDA